MNYTASVRETLNKLWASKIPCVFCLDFELEKPFVSTDFKGFLFDFKGSSKPLSVRMLEKTPPTFEEYKQGYDLVFKEIGYGNSFLVNFTARTKIKLSTSLEDLYYSAKAPYKFYKENEFLFFSPETFIKIEKGRISSFPMKGTIDASIENAEEKILSDRKESAEHATIVDLIRNDLAIVADNVRVDSYRYLSRIKTERNELIQVSSEVSGDLKKELGLGDILYSLLPAGSISGAPKKKTIEIIKEAESDKRGYFTGVCGYFDGESVDSCVMIRFIEQLSDGTLLYRSGGGITINSDPKLEYQEMIDKVYVPTV